MLTEPGPRPSFAPRNWPGWLIVAVLWLLGHTPATLALWLAHPLGGLMRVTMASRRKVAERNLQACFPELSAQQQGKLLRGSFYALARAVFETAWIWAGAAKLIARISQLNGFENLEAAQSTGRGVLLMGLHSTCLEMGGHIVGMEMKRRGWIAAPMYRPLKNEVVEWYQNRGRLQYADGMISKRNMRSAIRQLRRGNIVWYAPDQDFGPDQTAFAPFFGIQTASLLATHKLAALTGCAVVPMHPFYDVATKSYRLRLLPALQGFPSNDEAADLTRINRLTEELIRAAPDQYWWVHRRFKTRPPGEPPFYS
jgi:KDO2-lipid IV(A) lauroyltransferase